MAAPQSQRRGCVGQVVWDGRLARPSEAQLRSK
jgi:hypothetical protein